MIVRDLKLEDHLTLWQFAKELEQRGQVTAAFFWPPELVVAELQTHSGVGAFHSNGDLIAYILYRRLPQVREIISLVTHPDHRKQGIMESLLKSFQEQLPLGEEIWLEVHSENLSARNLYEKLGFKKLGERPKYYRDGASAIVMGWRAP